MFCVRCHNYGLESPLDRETGLDIFKVDPEYEQHEAEYKVTPAVHSVHPQCIMTAVLQCKYIGCLHVVTTCSLQVQPKQTAEVVNVPCQLGWVHSTAAVPSVVGCNSGCMCFMMFVSETIRQHCNSKAFVWFCHMAELAFEAWCQHLLKQSPTGLQAADCLATRSIGPNMPGKVAIGAASLV